MIKILVTSSQRNQPSNLFPSLSPHPPESTPHFNHNGHCTFCAVATARWPKWQTCGALVAELDDLDFLVWSSWKVLVWLLVANIAPIVVRSGAPSSFLLLVAMPGAPSSVLAPSTYMYTHVHTVHTLLNHDHETRGSTAIVAK